MALHYSGQVCELREVVLKAKPLELLAASAKGTVPVLVLEDTVIDESLDLMTWAVAQNDPDNWSAVNAQHALVKRNDEYFTYWLNRYKYADRYPVILISASRFCKNWKMLWWRIKTVNCF